MGIGLRRSGVNLHRQVLVSHPNGQELWVDEGLVAFLQVLWSKGIETRFSCEGEVSGRFSLPRKARAYVLMTRCPVASELYSYLTSRHEGFSQGYILTWPEDSEEYVYPRGIKRASYGVELDHAKSDRASRITLRFPRSEMASLREFIEAWAPQGS